MSKFVKKIGADATYKRPKVTYQEALTSDEIKEKLEGYKKIESFDDIAINTHIRYFTLDENNEYLFRTGGFLLNKTNADKYVILSNGKVSWPVQVESSIFYAKISHKEQIDALKEMYMKKLREKDKKIKELQKYINDNIPKKQKKLKK